MLLLAVLAAGCAPTSAPDAGGATPRAGGSVTVAMQYDMTNLDPAVFTSVTDQQIGGSIYDGLVRYRLGGTEIEPALAEKWTVSVDGKTYTFTLRGDAVFHKDYGPVRSSDVKFTIERLKDPALKSPWAALYRSVTRIDTPDERTVTVTLSAADTSFLVTLAGSSGFVQSERAHKERGSKYAYDPIGTGAFVFDRWTPQVELVLLRNPTWWGGRVKLDQVVYRPIPDPSTMYAAFDAGDVDLIQVTDPDRYERYRSDPNVTLSEKAGLITRFVGMNSRIAPFDKKEVREAVVYAIDRPALIKGLFAGMSEPAVGPVAPGVDAYTKELTDRTYNPARAKELLAKAGLADGFRTTFFVPNIDRFTKPATVIQQSLEAVGIKAEIKIVTPGALLAAIGKGEAPLFTLSRGQEPLADGLFYTWFHSKSFPPGQNFAYINDRELDGWIEAFRDSSDRARRAALAKQIQQRVLDGAFYVFIDHEKHVFAVRKNVKGYVVDPFRSLKLWPVSRS